MYPAWTVKSGLKSLCASSRASFSRSDAGGPGAQLGKCRSACACRVARSRGSGRKAEPGAGDDVARHVAPDEPGELGPGASRSRPVAPPAAAPKARDLDLGAQTSCLCALAHRVARARDALGSFSRTPPAYVATLDIFLVRGASLRARRPSCWRGSRRRRELRSATGRHRAVHSARRPGPAARQYPGSGLASPSNMLARGRATHRGSIHPGRADSRVTRGEVPPPRAAQRPRSGGASSPRRAQRMPRPSVSASARSSYSFRLGRLGAHRHRPR